MTRTLVILATVEDGPAVRLGDTLVDMAAAVRRALENCAFDVGTIDVRLDSVTA